jgi:hypothetical protein
MGRAGICLRAVSRSGWRPDVSRRFRLFESLMRELLVLLFFFWFWAFFICSLKFSISNEVHLIVKFCARCTGVDWLHLMVRLLPACLQPPRLTRFLYCLHLYLVPRALRFISPLHLASLHSTSNLNNIFSSIHSCTIRLAHSPSKK